MGLAYRVWLWLLIPIALSLATYGLVAQESRRRLLMAEASAELRNHATLVEAAVAGAAARGEVSVLKQRIERLAQADRILGIAVFDASGSPILVTDHIAHAAPELSALTQRALRSGDDLEDERELARGPALVRTVTFTTNAGEPRMVGAVVRDLGYVATLAGVLNRGLAITGVALLALTALIAAIGTRATVGRPAHAIVTGVERVANGDLEASVPERGADELARLAEAFNRMTRSLRDARDHAQHQETSRAAIERRLQHAQALAAVGQVAASIGHEIGTPLNVILGRARRAADRPGCPDELRGELETIATHSERISRVVARLLSTARPPQITGRGCDLGQVVEETLAFLGPECRQRTLRARVEANGAPARVALDADLAFQVVFNLCLNAAQAQADGGEIVVRIVAGAARGKATERVVLEVEDRGPGIEPDVAAHIFDPFFTSKAERGGTGLGLAIVDGIVREAGGTIELVRGSPGAVFRVRLPVERRGLHPHQGRATA